MKTLAIGLILILTPFLYTQAQNISYTQFHLSPVQTNPALISTSNQMQAILNFRSQSIDAGVAFQSPMFSFIYPWIKNRNKRKGAFAVSFLQDKTGEGGLMTTTGGLGTGALNFNLTPVAKDSSHQYNKYISVGFQLGYFQRRVNPDLFNSGAQWTGSGFDPNLPIGEQILDQDNFNAQRSFALYNFGALFYMADPCGKQKMYFGVNIQNLNQPNVAFFSEQNALPLQYVMSGGINFDLNHRITLQPNIRWVKLRTSNEYRVGTLAYYNFDGGTGFFGEGNMGAGLWYDSNGSVSLGAEVHQPNYFLGFSYDLGASASLQNLGNATWELSFGVKFGKRNKCLDDDKPLIERIRDTTTLEVRTELGDSVYTIVATIEGKEVLETDTIRVRFIPNAVSDLPTDEELKIFERKAFFYYLSDDINKTTAKLLDKIAKFMTRYKGVKLELEGHTCNIGITEERNMALSKRRSQAVKDYLLSRGVSGERLIISGFGSSRPLLSNRVEYGRIKNRRVEFKVLSIGDDNK